MIYSPFGKGSPESDSGRDLFSRVKKSSALASRLGAPPLEKEE
jgi:hypothetical protein